MSHISRVGVALREGSLISKGLTKTGGTESRSVGEELPLKSSGKTSTPLTQTSSVGFPGSFTQL